MYSELHKSSKLVTIDTIKKLSKSPFAPRQNNKIMVQDNEKFTKTIDHKLKPETRYKSVDPSIRHNGMTRLSKNVKNL